MGSSQQLIKDKSRVFKIKIPMNFVSSSTLVYAGSVIAVSSVLGFAVKRLYFTSHDTEETRSEKEEAELGHSRNDTIVRPSFEPPTYHVMKPKVKQQVGFCYAKTNTPELQRFKRNLAQVHHV